MNCCPKCKNWNDGYHKPDVMSACIHCPCHTPQPQPSWGEFRVFIKCHTDLKHQKACSPNKVCVCDIGAIERFCLEQTTRARAEMGKEILSKQQELDLPLLGAAVHVDDILAIINGKK